jgi:hypothetical protein
MSYFKGAYDLEPTILLNGLGVAPRPTLPPISEQTQYTGRSNFDLGETIKDFAPIVIGPLLVGSLGYFVSVRFTRSETTQRVVTGATGGLGLFAGLLYNMAANW